MCGHLVLRGADSSLEVHSETTMTQPWRTSRRVSGSTTPFENFTRYVLTTQKNYVYTHMHRTHICRLYPNLCHNTSLALYIENEGGQSTGDTEES